MPDTEPEPQPELMEPNSDNAARESVALYTETDAAFGALLEELQAVHGMAHRP